jgi:hypothetical protein
MKGMEQMNGISSGLALAPNKFESPSQSRTAEFSSLRLSQDFQEMTDLTGVVTTITMGKPNQHVFFRTHTEWSGLFPILELKQGVRSEFYIVDPIGVKCDARHVCSRYLTLSHATTTHSEFCNLFLYCP